MIQGIKFELKKYVMTKIHFAILLILTLVGVGILIWNDGGYLYEKTLRRDFYSQVGETFSEADKQKWTEERDQLDQELYETDKNGAILPNREEMEKAGIYSDTKLDDYAMLGDALRCIEVVEQRNRNTALVANDSPDYEKEENHMLADRKRLSVIVNSMTFGWMPCVALIIILSASFAVEYENNVKPVLSITKKGYEISLAKMLTGVFLAVILNIYFWGAYFLLQTALLGVTGKDWGQPLFLVEDYQMCASGATIHSFLVKQVMVSILVSILVAIATMAMSKWIKKSVYALLVSLALFVIALIPDLLNMAIYSNKYVAGMNDWYFLSEPAFYRMLKWEKMINPISAIQFQYYVEQPRYVQILDYQYPSYCFPLILAMLLIGILSIVLLYESRGRRNK